MDRRTFLRRGLLGGALLVFGGLLAALWPPRREHRPTRWLQVLDEGAFAVLAAVAACTLEGAQPDPVQVAHVVDETIARRPREMQRDFLRLLSLLESPLSRLVLDGSLSSFTRLSLAERARVLEGWRSSRLALRRSGYIALRKLTLAAHYASPTSWAGVGYPGPPEIAEG